MRWVRTSVSVSELKVCPFSCSHVPQDRVVLDDAVVDERDAVAALRIVHGAGGRWSRSPRRAWPSGCGRCRRCPRIPSGWRARLLEHPYPPDRAGHVHFRVHHRHARRVVAAVLEPLQPLEQKGLCGLVTDVGDDSAHGLAPSISRTRLLRPEFLSGSTIIPARHRKESAPRGDRSFAMQESIEYGIREYERHGTNGTTHGPLARDPWTWGPCESGRSPRVLPPSAPGRTRISDARPVESP